jgi:hypothetical protein
MALLVLTLTSTLSGTICRQKVAASPHENFCWEFSCDFQSEAARLVLTAPE